VGPDGERERGGAPCYRLRLPTDFAARPRVLMYLDSGSGVAMGVGVGWGEGGEVISGFRCLPINTEAEAC
jgi:hypothetical protein